MITKQIARNRGARPMTCVDTLYCKAYSNPAKIKWKRQFRSLARDFLLAEVVIDSIIYDVESAAKANEGNNVRYEKARQKMLRAVFG